MKTATKKSRKTSRPLLPKKLNTDALITAAVLFAKYNAPEGR
jgi:hypothetical protein